MPKSLIKIVLTPFFQQYMTVVEQPCKTSAPAGPPSVSDFTLVKRYRRNPIAVNDVETLRG